MATDSTAAASLARNRLSIGIAAVLIVAFGIFIRTTPWAWFRGMGPDESIYRSYLLSLDHGGLTGYPAICKQYIESQSRPGAPTMLPPTRFLYVYCGWAWKRVAFGDAPPANPDASGFARSDPALVSLHCVSSLFSCLLFLAAGVLATRMLGGVRGLGVLALMVCSPIQIHMAQHALIDGFFAFWATLSVWMLWENLRRPNHPGWLTAYGVSLALMVLTKENSFFAFVGLCGLIGVNRWAKFGVVTSRLLLVTVVGAAAGLVILVVLAGGLNAFIDIYRLLVTSAQSLTYAIRTGDGPWYRYLVDLMLMSPLVLCLAIGGFFSSVKTSRSLLFLSMFVAFTYLVMCNVRYGMNLRYATIWEFPLCALATVQVGRIARACGARGPFVGVLIMIALCAYSLRQYTIFFVDYNLYELASEGLLRAVRILKSL